MMYVFMECNKTLSPQHTNVCPRYLRNTKKHFDICIHELNDLFNWFLHRICSLFYQNDTSISKQILFLVMGSLKERYKLQFIFVNKISEKLFIYFHRVMNIAVSSFMVYGELRTTQIWENILLKHIDLGFSYWPWELLSSKCFFLLPLETILFVL